MIWKYMIQKKENMIITEESKILLQGKESSFTMLVIKYVMKFLIDF